MYLSGSYDWPKVAALDRSHHHNGRVWNNNAKTLGRNTLSADREGYKAGTAGRRKPNWPIKFIILSDILV